MPGDMADMSNGAALAGARGVAVPEVTVDVSIRATFAGLLCLGGVAARFVVARGSWSSELLLSLLRRGERESSSVNADM